MDKKEYLNSYRKEQTTKIELRFLNRKDMDIVNYLKDIPFRMDYFRDLIRADMKKRGVR